MSPLGRHQEAIDDCTAALEINPKLIQPRLSRGFEYINIGENKKGLDDYEIALRNNGVNPLALLHEGQVLGFQGQYEEAARALKSGIEQFRYQGVDKYYETEVSPDIETATGQTVLYVEGAEAVYALYLELANLKAYAGDPGFAAALKAADDLKATSTGGAFFALNWAWQHTKNRPDDYGALAAQGALWERAGIKDWAKEYYERFDRACSTNRLARYDKLAEWVSQRLQALQDVSPPAPRTPPPSLLALEAQELLQKEEFAQARMRLDQAIAQEPDNLKFRVLRALVLLKQQNFDDAKNECDIILAKEPRVDTAYWLRAAADLLARKKPPGPEVESDLRKAIDCSYSLFQAEALVWLSDIVASRDPDEALGLLGRSLDVSSDVHDLPSIYSRMANLQNQLGRFADARKAAQKAITLKSDVLGFYQTLSRSEEGLQKNVGDAIHNVTLFCRKQAEARSTLGRHIQAINTLWQKLFQSGQFGPYQQVFKDEIARLSSSEKTEGSAQ